MTKNTLTAVGLAAFGALVGCAADPGEDESVSQRRDGMYDTTSSTTTVATTGSGGCGTGGADTTSSTTSTTSSSSSTGPECAVVVVEDLYECIAPGNPRTECGDLGLVPIGKDDELRGLSFVATMDAYVAIVASGRGDCPRHSRSAAIYVDVVEGDLLRAPGTQGISHVTYCGCPPLSDDLPE